MDFFFSNLGYGVLMKHIFSGLNFELSVLGSKRKPQIHLLVLTIQFVSSFHETNQDRRIIDICLFIFKFAKTFSYICYALKNIYM